MPSRAAHNANRGAWGLVAAWPVGDAQFRFGGSNHQKMLLFSALSLETSATSPKSSCVEGIRLVDWTVACYSPNTTCPPARWFPK